MKRSATTEGTGDPIATPSSYTCGGPLHAQRFVDFKPNCSSFTVVQTSILVHFSNVSSPCSQYSHIPIAAFTGMLVAVSPTFTHTRIPPLSSGSVFDKSNNQPLYNIFYLCSTQSGILAHIINTITCTSEIPRNFQALECQRC